jgi:Mg2+/Co2+ transporter CorB
MTACRRSFGNLLSTARRVKVKTVMHLPADMGYVAEDAPIEEAACRLMAGPHPHLFVRSGDQITGILRLSDLFLRLCEEIKKSGPD